jgi:hypothetical protein
VSPLLPRYKTDFNDVDEDGFVTTLPGWDGSMLVPNEQDVVLLFDGDENTCVGVVDHVDMATGLIYVRPIWEEWSDGTHSTLPSLMDALVESITSVNGQETRSSVTPT